MLPVFILADNKARKTRIQTGFNDGAQVEVTGGLNPDQPVIVVGKRALADGQLVSVSESK